MNIMECPVRVCGKTHQLIRWKNLKTNTPFAPEFDVPMWTSIFPTKLTSKILSEVREIEYEYNLGEKYFTWMTYNLFSWNDKFTFIDELLDLIKNNYSKYISTLEYPHFDNLYIRGWVCILSGGESLPLHSHSYHENTFLSGNLMLNDSQTSTEYLIPHWSTHCGNYLSPNSEGSFLLFPSWVEHFCPVVEHKRYCLAFDIFTKEGMDYSLKNSDKNDPMLLSIKF